MVGGRTSLSTRSYISSRVTRVGRVVNLRKFRVRRVPRTGKKKQRGAAKSKKVQRDEGGRVGYISIEKEQPLTTIRIAPALKTAKRLFFEQRSVHAAINVDRAV